MTPALVLFAGLSPTAPIPQPVAREHAEWKRLEGAWWLGSIGGCGTVDEPLHVFHGRRLLVYTREGAKRGCYDVTLDTSTNPPRMTLASTGQEPDGRDRWRSTWAYELAGDTLVFLDPGGPARRPGRAALVLERFRQIAPPPRAAR